VHRAIAALQPGDPLRWRHDGRRWLLLDAQDRLVGRLAASYVPPVAMDCVAARVAAILVRLRSDDQSTGHAQRTRCARWEVVLPELVFAPASRRP
jgi:ATP-dependent DNA helicase RecQ